MLKNNVRVLINIQSSDENYLLYCNLFENLRKNTGINIFPTKDQQKSFISFNLNEYSENFFYSIFKFKKIILTNGIKTFEAVLFPEIKLFVSEKEYGLIEFYNNNDLLLIKTLENTKISLSKVPNKENEFFYFTSRPDLENTSNMYKQRTSRMFKSEKLNCLTHIISKNGCSSIVNLFYNLDVRDVDEKWFPWDWKNVRSVYVSSIFVTENQKNEKKNQQYRSFITLRDPISRFVSLVNYCKCRYNHVGYPYIFPYRYSNNKEEFIDVIIQITKGLNLLNDIFYHDDHFMSQSMHLGGVDLTKIDDIVLTSDLSEYFKEVYNVNLPRVNENRETFITNEDLLPRHIESIKEIFKDDYFILSHTDLWKK